MGIGDAIAGYRQSMGLSPNAFVNPRDAMKWSEQGGGVGGGIPLVGEGNLPAVEIQRGVASFTPPASISSTFDPGYQSYTSRAVKLADLSGGNEVFPEVMSGNLSQSPAMRQQWYDMSVENPQTASIMKNKVNQLRQAYIAAPPERRDAITQKGLAAKGRLEELLQGNVERLAAREAGRPERPFPVADYYLGKNQGTNYDLAVPVGNKTIITGEPVGQVWEDVTSRNMAPGMGVKETMSAGPIYMPDNPRELPGIGYRSNLTSDINPTIDAWSKNASVADLGMYQEGKSSMPFDTYDRYARSGPGPADSLSFAPQYAAQGRSTIAVPGHEVNIMADTQPVTTPSTIGFNRAAPVVEVVDPAVGEAARRNFYAGKEQYESLLPSITQLSDVGPGARMTVGEVKAADALDQMVEAGNFIKGRGVPDTRDYSVLQPVEVDGGEKLSDIVGRRNLLEQQSRLQGMGQSGFTPTEILRSDPRVEALRNRVIEVQAPTPTPATEVVVDPGMAAANRMYEISNRKFDQADAIAQAKNQSYAAQSAFQDMAQQSAMKRAATADSLRARAQSLIARKGMPHLAI
jgi:hypothetical protein